MAFRRANISVILIATHTDIAGVAVACEIGVATVDSTIGEIAGGTRDDPRNVDGND
jgi:hypothetical protein